MRTLAVPAGPGALKSAALAAALAILVTAGPRPCAAAEVPPLAEDDPQLHGRVRSAVDVGLKYLRFRQLGNGSWNDDVVATALIVQALAESHRRYSEEDGPFVRLAMEYIAGSVGTGRSPGDEPPGEGATLEEAAVALLALRHASDSRNRGAIAAAEADLRRHLPSPAGERQTRSANCWELGLALQALRELEPDTPARQAASALTATCRIHGAVDREQDELWRDVVRAGAGLEGILPGPREETLRRAIAAVQAEPASYRRYYFVVAALEAQADSLPPAAAGDLRAWRIDLARRLCDGQRDEGDWRDEGPAAAGEDPLVASAFAILALERLFDG